MPDATEPPVTGNIADLINNLFGKNNNSINIISSGIGTLADAGGAIGLVLTVVGWFNSQPDPIQAVLDALRDDFAQLYKDLEARQNEEDWRSLAELVSASEGVFEILDGLVKAQPPLTDEQRLDHIATCLAPLNALSDASADPPSSFFLAVYSEQVYWDDVYYGSQAPSAYADGQVFSYVYILPYYLKALLILTAVGTAFFADFGKTAQHEQDSVIKFSNFLVTVHDLISAGITKLFARFPGRRTGDGDALIFEYGAVEKFSGFSSVKSLELPGPPHNPGLMEQKLRVRALGEMQNVYAGVGLPGVWAAINSLNKLAGRSAIPPSQYARWSFREIFSEAGSNALSNGFFHLSDMAKFLRRTPPTDMAQTGPVSWRSLLGH
jgi:hypothetical protein